MAKALRLPAWAMWSLWYLLPGTKPREFGPWMKMIERTWFPFKTFIPNAWHNDDGSQWHVSLTDESYYVNRATIQVEAYFSFDDGRCVGFNVWDETLRKIADEERQRRAERMKD